MKKRLLAIFLMTVLCMVLTSCQKGEPELEGLETTENQESASQGSWKETFIPCSSIEIAGVVLLEDNEAPAYLGYESAGGSEAELRRTYQWKDGTWAVADLPSEKAYNEMAGKNKKEENVYYNELLKHQDGNYYYLKAEYPKKLDENTLPQETKFTLYRFNNKNRFEKVNLKQDIFFDGKGKSTAGLWNFNVLDDGSIAVSFPDKVIRYDMSTMKQLSVCEFNSKVFNGLVGNEFYTMNNELNKIQVKDLKTGETMEEIDFKATEDKENGVQMCFSKDKEGTLYIATTDGIFRRKSDSAEIECMIPAEQCVVYNLNDKKDTYILDMGVSEQNIYVSYFSVSKDKEQLYQYSMDS